MMSPEFFRATHFQDVFPGTLINRLFVQGVEDFWRHRHPGRLCNQHVLCRGLRDSTEYCAALCPRLSAFHSLSVLCWLSGEFHLCDFTFIS